MIKIAILGCDSTHTEAYTRLINDLNSPFFEYARVCWIWGEDLQQATEKSLSLGIDNVLESLDHIALMHADLIMVIGRFGDSHYRPAMCAIESGKPVFVDKPFTNCNIEARELIEAAKKRKVLLISFSPLRFSNEIKSLSKKYTESSNIQTIIATSPMITRTIQDERVNSVYFYSIHAVDVLLSLLKKRPVSVKAHRHKNGVWAEIIFNDQTISVLNLTIDQPETYQVTVFDFDGSIATIKIDTEGAYYRNTLEYLFGCLQTQHANQVPHTQSLDAIRVLTALDRSLSEKTVISLDEEI
jgi:predicted dehydrogenase